MYVQGENTPTIALLIVIDAATKILSLQVKPLYLLLVLGSKLTMDEAQRLQAKRRGLRGSVTKLLAKVDNILSGELATTNLSSTPESRRLLASTTATQLMAKKNQITQLDDAIVATIEGAEELESEVCDADTYSTTLEERIAFLEEFVKRANQPPLPTPHEVPEESRLRESHELISATLDVDTPSHEPKVVKKPVHSIATIPTTQERDETLPMDGTHHSYSGLPKLALPTFSDNPLEWQTFWDSFSAAVDCNPHLSGAQKLNYLRTQLHGDPAHIIDGFPLNKRQLHAFS